MSDLPRIQSLAPHFRHIIGAFVVMTSVGVFTGFAFLGNTTHLEPQGIVTQYKGMDEAQMEVAGELKFEKSFRDMLLTTHNHVLGLSPVFLAIGLLYLQCGKVTRLRSLIAIEPLLSLGLTFGGLWVVRFWFEPFVYVVLLSGILMFACFFWMAAVILRSCFRPQPSPGL
ncbi:MAG: hypothetical protein KDI06_19200 [Calditrichaeota bacterium]|nr:hypothetical protein [Calditrichota bacterium]HQU73180.1 hypothetical protein [Calditrichia bacterium]